MLNDDRVFTDPSTTILEASHIVIRPGCRPKRVVLYKNPYKATNEFVVHIETLQQVDPPQFSTDSCSFRHHAFSDGIYCRTMESASARFDERVALL